MSAGAFDKAFYLADYGAGTNVHPIRVQPETRQAATSTETNDIPGAVQTSPISAIVSRSRSSRGLIARVLYLQLVGSPPTGYSPGSRTRIPALTPAFYNSALAIGASILYLGTTWKTIGSSDEEVG